MIKKVWFTTDLDHNADWWWTNQIAAKNSWSATFSLSVSLASVAVFENFTDLRMKDSWISWLCESNCQSDFNIKYKPNCLSFMMSKNQNRCHSSFRRQKYCFCIKYPNQHRNASSVTFPSFQGVLQIRVRVTHELGLG